MILNSHNQLDHDLRLILTQYQCISEVLARRFFNEYKAVIDNIKFMPEQWPIVDSNLRQALLTKFPYTVYYRIISEDHIRIVGVKHQHRDPEIFRSRE